MKVVTIDEASRLAGVARRTVLKWVQDGRVQFIRTVGGKPRIVADSLFIAGNVEPVDVERQRAESR